MKKWLSALLAVVLTASLCAGCAAEPPSGLYYDVTGIAPTETVMEVDGNAIPAEQYLYWLAYNCSSLEYNLGMYHAYYGAYSELFSDTGALNWNADFTGGVSLSQYAKDQAEEAIRFYANIENMAAAQGIELTDEDRAAMEAAVADMTEQLGGEEAFQENLYQMGISRKTYDRITATTYLFDHLVDLVLDETSSLYLPPEGYDQYAVYADHILLATVDLSTYAALDEETIAAKRQKAEELLAQLQAADDPEALFAQLADENSEDTGRASNPDGYVFGKGEMVEAFEEAAFALLPGELSGIVESDYGFHIILRKDLAGKLEADSELRREYAEQHLNTLLRAQSEVVRSDKLDGLDAGTFFLSYTAALDAYEAAHASDETDSEDGGSTPDSADGAAPDSTTAPATPGSTDGTAE